MTQDMMTLRALLEKSSDADLLREMIGFTAERLMALNVPALTAGSRVERNALTPRAGIRSIGTSTSNDPTLTLLRWTLRTLPTKSTPRA